MKQVVLSITEDSDKRLRKLASEYMDGRKGSLSKTVEDALILLDKRIRQERGIIRLKELANEDINYGVGRFERTQAYKSARLG